VVDPDIKLSKKEILKL